jgi:hypothetical protein
MNEDGAQDDKGEGLAMTIPFVIARSDSDVAISA